MHELLNTVILLGAVQGAILGATLWARRKDRVANRILAGLIGGVSLMLVLQLLNEPGFAGHPHLIGLGIPLPFLFAPLLYLYILALTLPAARFERRWLVHAAPFAIYLLYLLPVFYLKSSGEKLALAQAHNAGQVLPVMRLFEILLVVQAVSYLAASWVALHRYARKIEGFFSDLARIDLRWLKAMVLAHAAVWSVVTLGILLRAVGAAAYLRRGFGPATDVGSTLIIFLTGYMSLWQPEVFEKAQAAEPARPLPRYQRNRLEDEEAETLARKVTARMTEGKLYRNSALTLQALADEVGATPHMLSQVLNLRLRKSFFVLVNSYRAEELMAALTDPRKGGRGVLELALEAGFNSKSTLNSFFKRYTGVTPTEFRLLRSPAKSAQISAG